MSRVCLCKSSVRASIAVVMQSKLYVITFGRSAPLACPTLETTQGHIHGCFSQLPHKCHLNRVASVGD